MLGRRRRVTQALGVVLACGVLVAVLTAQVRIALVGLAVALVAVVLLSVASRRIWQATATITAVAVLALVAASFVSGRAGGGVFDRYSSLTSRQGPSNTVGYKQGTLELLPEDAAKHPFGQGLGALGPAASIAGAPESSGHVSGESEFNFLLVEVGVPGLLILLAFQLTVIGRSVRRLRHESDPEARLLLSAMLAALIAITVLWFGGPVTAAPPLACFMWLASGTLAYWCLGGRDQVHGAALRLSSPAA
jgi:O-antigen ligase